VAPAARAGFALARNPISAIGVGLATLCGALFLLLTAAEWFGWQSNPYFGIVLFLVIPLGLVLGLLLIAFGNAWYRFRGKAEAAWPRIDLNNRRHQRIVLAGLVLSSVNIVIVSMAAYGGIHYMESASFCGQVCHQAMAPQFMAYQDSPHSSVPCVACHVGAGADALVASKVNGIRQLALYASERYSRPVPSPVHTLRPARDTCETCHWPEKIHGDRLKVIREYADDEENSETTTTLRIHVGGGSHRLGIGSGIHWHMNLSNQIEYIATDRERQVIPYVSLRSPDGMFREYRVEGVSDEELARGERRRMDCMDCHNRPSHTFFARPERAVDQALEIGRVSRELPFVRREMVAALKAESENGADAGRKIAEHLEQFYRREYPEVADRAAADIAKAVAVAQDLFERNVFPGMRVSWGTYPNELGHLDFPGCFRCHDEEHRSADGKVIGQDCETCHSIE
jgi:hypothetical protein